MALTDESAPQLCAYTLRNEGGPFTDIFDPDGNLRITVYPDLLADPARGWDPASIPAAEALTRRILAALHFLRDIPTEKFDGASLKGFAEIMDEAIRVGPGRLSSPTRSMLDGLRGAQQGDR